MSHSKRMEILRYTVEDRLTACQMIVAGMRNNDLSLTNDGVELHSHAVSVASKVRY